MIDAVGVRTGEGAVTDRLAGHRGEGVLGEVAGATVVREGRVGRVGRDGEGGVDGRVVVPVGVGGVGAWGEGPV